MSYMTETRRMIQSSAREFSMKEVLPVANELDTMKGDIPMSLRDQMGELGYFGIRIPRGVRRPRSRRVRVRARDRRAGARLDERRQHHRARQRLSAATRSRDGAAPRRTCRAWRGASTSAPRRFPSRTPAPTSATSPCRADREDGERLGAHRHEDVVHVRRWRRLHDRARAHAEPVTDVAHRHRGIGTFFIEKERGTLPPRLHGHAREQDRLPRLEDVGAPL